MSGGSYNCAYSRVLEMADEMESRPDITPERHALCAHMRVVAEAMRMVEWVDSGDCSPGDENPAIAAALGGKEREFFSSWWEVDGLGPYEGRDLAHTVAHRVKKMGDPGRVAFVTRYRLRDSVKKSGR